MEKPKFKIGHPASTESHGHGVVVESTNSDLRDYPVTVDFDGVKRTFTEDGKRFEGDKYPSLRHGNIDYSVIEDILPVEKKTVWYNVYQGKDGSPYFGGLRFTSKAEAKLQASKNNRIDTISLEIDDI